jgi:hypothetical protein
MSTFHYIMTPLEKVHFLHPNPDVRMWGIKRVFARADGAANALGGFDSVKVYDGAENFLGVSYSTEEWVEG